MRPVKSVKGDKQSLELMKRQVAALNEYVNKLQSPLIFAIFWEKYGLWTHVPIDVFEEKEKKYKITIMDAFKADVSAVFGDISFIIAGPIYRKTLYGTNENNSARHEKFGSVIQDYLSADGENYFEISQVESAVIDSTIKMKKESDTKDGNETTVIEKSEGHYILKLDNIMNRHLAVFGVEPTYDYYDFSRRTVIELMKKLSVKISYAIPAIVNELTTAIYQKTFSNSFVWDNYQSAHSDSDSKKSE